MTSNTSLLSARPSKGFLSNFQKNKISYCSSPLLVIKGLSLLPLNYICVTSSRPAWLLLLVMRNGGLHTPRACGNEDALSSLNLHEAMGWTILGAWLLTSDLSVSSYMATSLLSVWVGTFFALSPTTFLMVLRTSCYIFHLEKQTSLPMSTFLKKHLLAQAKLPESAEPHLNKSFSRKPQVPLLFSLLTPSPPHVKRQLVKQEGQQGPSPQGAQLLLICQPKDKTTNKTHTLVNHH
ncbi:hypothetical protein J3F83DRAFT_534503 [Trichoderma novae-zelandiae]